MPNFMNIASLPESSGIYSIIAPCGKIYVGSSLNIKRRIRNHINDLLKNKHHNIKLQRYVNKYRMSGFTISVLELTSKEKLLERELHFIKIKRSYKRKHGFNISKETDRPGTRINCKKVTLVKNEKDYKFNSINEASKILKIDRNRITEVINKKRNNYKGFTLKGVSVLTKYQLRDPSGNIHSFDNSIKFGELNNLDRKGVHQLIHGKWRYHRGWTCPKYEIVLTAPDKINFILNTSIKSFCRRHNLKSPSKLNAVILGHAEHYKGWTLSKFS